MSENEIPAYPRDPRAETNWHVLAGIVRRRRWFVLTGVGLGLVAAIVIASRQVPVYEASALIRVDEQESKRLPTLDLLLGGLAAGNEIGTEMEVLRSRTLAEAVVDSLHLRVRVAEPRSVPRSRIFSAVEVRPGVDSVRYRLIREGGGSYRVENAATGERLGSFEPGGRAYLPGAAVVLAPTLAEHPLVEVEILTREQAVTSLMEGMRISQPSREANIIRVEYRGTDPEVVRDVPNVLAARFVDLRQRVQKTEATSTIRFLRQQLDTLAVQLRNAEEDLRAFRESEQVVNLPVESSTQVGQLAALQAERAQLEAERAALAELVEEVRASARSAPAEVSPYRRLIAFPSLLRNGTASELLRSLGALEDERAALLMRRSARDPDVQVLTTRIQELETQLQSLVTTYLQGLTNQVASIDRTLGQFQRHLDQVPAKEMRLARLSRHPQVLDHMYELLQTRLKEAEIAQAVEDPSVRVVDAAVMPSRPINSHRSLILGGGLLIGLLLGVGAGFAREYTDQVIRTRHDVQIAAGIPVLGLIPRIEESELPSGARGMLPRAMRLLAPLRGAEGNGGSARLLVPAATTGSGTSTAFMLIGRASAPSPLSDAFHRLHINVLFARPDTEMKTLLFTSPLPGDGKTTTATSLAITLAQRGLNVLLIDADLRRGTVHSVFQAPRLPGLSNLLIEMPIPEAVIRTIDVGSGKPLSYLTTGTLPPNPVQILESAGMQALLEWARGRYDKIIIDSPPLNVVPDAALLGGSVDGVVVVARAGVTPFEALVYTAEQFRNGQAAVVGAVLNDVDFERDASYDGAYRWYTHGKKYYAAVGETELQHE